MRYVVIGDYREINAFQRKRGLALHEVIPVPQSGSLGQALAGLNPWDVTIVQVHGSERWMDPEAVAWLEHYQAQGAGLLVEA